MEVFRKYGAATTVYVPLIKAGSNDQALAADFTHSAGDTKVIKDGGAAANITTAPSAIAMGNGATWKISLSATEMQAAQIVVNISDAATKAVEDQQIIICTYGNASAEHAVDLDDSVRAGLTSLPNAAADAAGGLPISDAGGLDLDTLNSNVSAVLTDTGELQTDWTNGGRLDLILDAILDDTGTNGVLLAAGAIDAIWNESMTAHTTANTAGLFSILAGGVILDATVTGTPTTTSLDISGGNTNNGFYNDCMCYIISGTGALQARPILASTYSAGTTTLTFDEAFVTTPAASDRAVIQFIHLHPKSQVADSIWDEATSGHATAGTTGLALADILADTNELQTDNVPGLIAALNNLSAAQVNAECDTAISDAALATAAALATVDANVDTIKLGIITGTAQTGTLSTTQATTDLTGYGNDQLIGRVIIWTSGACDGEATDITDYVSASGLLTFTALTTAPSNGDTFKIV